VKRRSSWYQRLLALFPADFRGDFGTQMEADFDDQRREASARGRGATVGLWSRTIAGFLRVGPREHASRFLADMRHGVRLAGRQPGSTLASALVLALGVAAVTSAFTIADAFLLRPLPFPDPDTVVHVWATNRQTGLDSGRVSLPEVDAWAAARSTRGVAAFNYTEEDLTGNGRPERISAARVSANVFDVLGVYPQVGRAFAAGDDRPGAAPVALVSRRFAQQRFGSSEGVIGRTVEIGGRSHTIIGIMPGSFVFPLPVTDVWLPYVFDPAVYTQDLFTLQAVARLAPGVTPEAAERELAALTAALWAPHGDVARHRSVRFESLRNALNFADEFFRVAAPVMLLASCLILLAACANVASVLLGRAITRAREVAVRSAVGASRLRLFRQFVAESGLLVAAALALGLLLAQWWLWWIQGLLPLDLYRVGEIAIGGRTVAVAALAAVVAVFTAASLPALRFGRIDLTHVLRLDGGGSTVSPRAARLQNLLLVAQVTFSVALLVSAFVAGRVVLGLSDREPGFDRDRILTIKFILGSDRYPRAEALRRFYEGALSEARALPAVEAAALVNHLPLNHETSTLTYAVPGERQNRSGPRRTTIEVGVSAEYFRTMGIALLEGRDFDSRDDESGLPVAVVNRALASRIRSSGSPIGQRLELGTSRAPVTIVGVVEDSRQSELVGDPEPIVFRPLTQGVRRHNRLVVRTSGDPMMLSQAVQAAVWKVDAALPLTEIRSLDQVMVDFLLPQRAMTISMTNMGVTGLLVTAIGLYGLLAVIVAQRQREIGVRMALGAGHGRVVGAIVLRSVRTTAIGLVCGVALSSLLTRSLATLLPGAAAIDLTAITGTLVVLTLVAAAAAFVPARRAARVDPLIVLRAD